jgi:hypothetical protein
MRRLLIPLILAALPLAACGGGSSTAKTASAAATKSTVSTASPASTKPPNFSGNSGSNWCDLDRSLQNSTQFQNAMKDPHTWARQLDSIASSAQSKAPRAIKSDVQTVVSALRVLEKALSDANYDFTKLNPTTMSGLNNPNLAAAADRITAYDKQVCGTKG